MSYRALPKKEFFSQTKAPIISLGPRRTRKNSIFRYKTTLNPLNLSQSRKTPPPFPHNHAVEPPVSFSTSSPNSNSSIPPHRKTLQHPSQHATRPPRQKYRMHHRKDNPPLRVRHALISSHLISTERDRNAPPADSTSRTVASFMIIMKPALRQLSRGRPR